MNRLNYFCKLPVDLILNLALEEKKMNFSIFFLTGKMNLYFYFSKYDEFLTANNMASTSTMWQSDLHGGLHAWHTQAPPPCRQGAGKTFDTNKAIFEQRQVPFQTGPSQTKIRKKKTRKFDCYCINLYIITFKKKRNI